MSRLQDMGYYRQALNNGWDIPAETRDMIIQEMLNIILTSNWDKEKIRAAEVLAKLDALNVQREQGPKGGTVNVAVLPPAYERLTDDANRAMTEYLQAVALPSPDSEAIEAETVEAKTARAGQDATSLKPDA